jgi:hypothetical protein
MVLILDTMACGSKLLRSFGVYIRPMRSSTCGVLMHEYDGLCQRITHVVNQRDYRSEKMDLTRPASGNGIDDFLTEHIARSAIHGLGLTPRFTSWNSFRHGLRTQQKARLQSGDANLPWK